MKELILKHGEIVLIDDEDYEILSQWHWYVHYVNGNPSSVIRCVHLTDNLKKQSIYMHRVLMETPQELEVDHIDRNPLNNQKSNLRNCTHAENHKNVTPWGEVKYRGVDIKNDQKRKKRFRATINLNYKQIFIGHYTTPEEAGMAYDIRAIQYYGEFAYLNFPELKNEYLKSPYLCRRNICINL